MVDGLNESKVFNYNFFKLVIYKKYQYATPPTAVSIATKQASSNAVYSSTRTTMKNFLRYYWKYNTLFRLLFRPLYRSFIRV